MIYILIVFWSHTASSIEFNSKDACQAATQEVRRQMRYAPEVMFCVAKGEKK